MATKLNKLLNEFTSLFNKLEKLREANCADAEQLDSQYDWLAKEQIKLMDVKKAKLDENKRIQEIQKNLTGLLAMPQENAAR